MDQRSWVGGKASYPFWKVQEMLCKELMLDARLQHEPTRAPAPALDLHQ